jgi:LysM domain
MIRRAMRRRNRARYLAPIALVAVIGGTYAVVNAGGLAPRHASPHQAHGGTRRRTRFTRSHFYVVQAGENLTSIAVKTGVGVGRLESLNPNLDPNALQTGQRLRLRR